MLPQVDAPSCCAATFTGMYLLDLADSGLQATQRDAAGDWLPDELEVLP